MMPWLRVTVGPIRSGVRRKRESSVKLAIEVLPGRVFPVSGHPRESYLQVVPIRPDGMYLHGLSAWPGSDHHRTGGEVEGDTQHVGVFHVEQAVIVQIVRLATQSATDHLLAQQLSSEGPHAQDVGDGAGVPPFGQHGNGHYAADLPTQSAFFADSVHHLSEQFGVGNVVRRLAVAGPFQALR